MEQIARFPLHHLTVKAEKEQLLAGRLVVYDGKSAEGDRTAIHAPAKAKRIFGCMQADTADPKAEPAPDPNDNELRKAIVRRDSIARVLASGEVKDGDEVQCAAGGKVATLSDGTAIGEAQSTGKDVIIEVELF